MLGQIAQKAFGGVEVTAKDTWADRKYVYKLALSDGLVFAKLSHSPIAWTVTLNIKGRTLDAHLCVGLGTLGSGARDRRKFAINELGAFHDTTSRVLSYIDVNKW